MHKNTRISVLAPDGTPLMPMKFYRAEALRQSGQAEWISNDLNIKQSRLLYEPSGRNVQDVVTAIDPGKLFSGMAVGSAKFTLFMAHLVLPFPNVIKKITARRILRRARRGRRINRKVTFYLRAHRQKRFNNRRQKRLPPSILANKQMELRVIQKLLKLFPISHIRYEVIKARGDKGFSPAMVGQKFMVQWLNKLRPTTTQEGWQTSILRQQLGLPKNKIDKAKQAPETHAHDAVALAASHFMQFKSFHTANSRGHHWVGRVQLSPAPFRVITRPNLFRRQLHFENFSKGGIRKRKGGTITPWGLRSGDFVRAEKADKVYVGWIGGYSEASNVVSVYDHNWKRYGQFSMKKIQLIRRDNGLCVA